MSVQSRGKKPVSYDSLQITDLDADFDDFTLFDDVNNDVKGNNHTPTITPPTKSSSVFNGSAGQSTRKTSGKNDSAFKTSPVESTFKSPVKVNSANKSSLEDTHSSAQNQTNSNGGKINETASVKNGTLLQGKNTPDVNTVPPNSARSAMSKQSDAKMTHTDALNARRHTTQPVTSARSNTKTPLNQRPPVSSVQITKRYSSTPQNKNTKAVGHDANDMYIDDIEDF